MPNFDMGRLGAMVAYTQEVLTVGTDAVQLSAALYRQTAAGANPAKAAIMAVEADTNEFLRMRLDGTDPTSTVGSEVDDQEFIRLRGMNALVNFSAIRDDGNASDVNVTVQYYR